MAHTFAAHMLAGAPQELCAHADHKLLGAPIDRDKFVPLPQPGRGAHTRFAHPRTAPDICTLTMRTARLSWQSAQLERMMADIA